MYIHHMRFHRNITGGLLVLCLLLSMTGCGSGAGSSAGEPGHTEAAAESTSAGMETGQPEQETTAAAPAAEETAESAPAGEPVSSDSAGTGTEAAPGTSENAAAGDGNAEASGDDDAAAAENTAFTDRDYEIGYSDYVTITLDGTSASADGSGVLCEDGTVTIGQAGTYLLTGSYQGQLLVDAADPDRIQLVLDGADLSTDGAAAIYVRSADKVFLTTARDSVNTISATGAAETDGETTVDGAVFSKADLTLNGAGTLSVVSKSGHAVVSKDDLKVTGGTLELTAAKQGLSGKDSVRIGGGTITIDAGGDALHADNAEDPDKGYIYLLDGSLTITAGDDGIHAESGITIDGGSIDIESSYEGIEATTITVNGGSATVVSRDDAVNASGLSPEIHINGGELVLDSEGDSLDVNGSLYITGGTICISGPTGSGNGMLDYDAAGEITGGTIMAAGASGMNQNFDSSSTQCSILVDLSGQQAAGTLITLTASDGTVIASYTPQKAFQSVLISAAELQQGETYTLTAGSETQSITLTDTIYGTGGGFGGFGGGGRGGFHGFG